MQVPTCVHVGCRIASLPMSITDARTKILEVAAKLYAEAGYRGTTTRRVANEAGVNEVTLLLSKDVT